MTMQFIRVFALLLIFLNLAAQQALAENYIIDEEGRHAFIQFKSPHFEFSYIIGRFEKFSGTFSYDESNPSATTINVTIEAASLDSNHAERDKHFRSSKFFDVNNYPVIAFSSTSFEETGNGNASITGDLTLHGITHSITIDAKHIGHGADPWGGYRRGLEGWFTLDPGDYGFPDWIGNVDIYLVAEGIRQ